jgi:hypothetical protein
MKVEKKIKKILLYSWLVNAWNSSLKNWWSGKKNVKKFFWNMSNLANFHGCLYLKAIFSFSLYLNTPPPHGSFIHWLKQLSICRPSTIWIKTKIALYVWEGLLPWAGFPLFLSLCPWANTLLTTPMTLKLREALGSKDSPIPKGP